MNATATIYVVLVNWDGNAEATPDVYQTADTWEEAVGACKWLEINSPGCYPQVMKWDEAEAMGYVS